MLRNFVRSDSEECGQKHQRAQNDASCRNRKVNICCFEQRYKGFRAYDIIVCEPSDHGNRQYQRNRELRTSGSQRACDRNDGRSAGVCCLRRNQHHQYNADAVADDHCKKRLFECKSGCNQRTAQQCRYAHHLPCPDKSDCQPALFFFRRNGFQCDIFDFKIFKFCHDSTS